MLSYFGQEIRFIIMNFKNFDRFVTKIFCLELLQLFMVPLDFLAEDYTLRALP